MQEVSQAGEKLTSDLDNAQDNQEVQQIESQLIQLEASYNNIEKQAKELKEQKQKEKAALEA